MVDRNQKYEDILPFYCIFRAFGSFYCDVVILNIHACLGRTKTRSPEFGTVLHWRPPDVHIFHTDQSLLQRDTDFDGDTLFDCQIVHPLNPSIVGDTKYSVSPKRSKKAYII